MSLADVFTFICRIFDPHINLCLISVAVRLCPCQHKVVRYLCSLSSAAKVNRGYMSRGDIARHPQGNCLIFGFWKCGLIERKDTASSMRRRQRRIFQERKSLQANQGRLDLLSWARIGLGWRLSAFDARAPLWGIGRPIKGWLSALQPWKLWWASLRTGASWEDFSAFLGNPDDLTRRKGSANYGSSKTDISLSFPALGEPWVWVGFIWGCGGILSTDWSFLLASLDKRWWQI